MKIQVINKGSNSRKPSEPCPYLIEYPPAPVRK